MYDAVAASEREGGPGKRYPLNTNFFKADLRFSFWILLILNLKILYFR